MAAKSWLMLLLPFLGQAAFGQSIEIQGRRIKLQPKPKEAYYQEPGSEWRDRTRSELPELVDIKASQTPVKDQANRGSCAYFTTIALFEHAFKRSDAQQRDWNLSEEFLIYANKALDRVNSNEDGSFLASNIRTAQNRGFLLESTHPYTHSWFEKGMPCAEFTDDSSAPSYCRSHFPPEATKLNALIKPEQFQVQIEKLSGLTAVMQRLKEGGAVTISLPVNQNGWQGPEGRVEHNQELEDECKAEPDLCGGHTVLLTGYDPSAEVFFFKNSWGRSWGKEGYGQLPFAYAERWSYGQFFTATSRRFEAPAQAEQASQELGPVSYDVRTEPGADGREGVKVSLRFDYKAPLGTFFYVSLFPQLKKSAEGDSSATSYETIYAPGTDGKAKLVADRRFILAVKPEDLSYNEARSLDLFVSKADLEAAGVWGKEELVLRPSIYSMSDTENYKVLYREYLALPQH